MLKEKKDGLCETQQGVDDKVATSQVLVLISNIYSVG